MQDKSRRILLYGRKETGRVMGVYIPGMRKPDSCMDCDMAIEDDYEYICPFSRCREDIKNCPLVEVSLLNSKNDELISKQDAVWAAHVRIKQIGYENDPNVLSIRQAVREVPPVQPELAKYQNDHEITKDVLDRWKSEMSANPMIVISEQPEIVRCKDCRHNRNCEIQYHALAGDMFYCGRAERNRMGDLCSVGIEFTEVTNVELVEEDEL